MESDDVPSHDDLLTLEFGLAAYRLRLLAAFIALVYFQSIFVFRSAIRTLRQLQRPGNG